LAVAAILVSVLALVVSYLAFRQSKRAVTHAVFPRVTACIQNDPPGRDVKHWIEVTNLGGPAVNIACKWGLADHPNGDPKPGCEEIIQLGHGCSQRLRETTERLFLKSAAITCEDAEGGKHWSRRNEGECQRWEFGRGDLPSR
jgi:hypothetical protein